MNTTIATGTRLRSQVCAGEVIVVRPAVTPVELTCGGTPMIPQSADPDPAVLAAGPAPGLAGGMLLGKRYTTAAGDLEVLVTRAGAGTLAVDGTPLVEKSARPLPSSD
jgi:hypothetical protein